MMNNNRFVPPQQQYQEIASQHFKIFVFEGGNDSLQDLDVNKASSIHRVVIPAFTTHAGFVKYLEDKKIIKQTEEGSEQVKVEQKMFFLDDESQWVTIANEDDWNVLWSLLRGQVVIKIAIVKKKEEAKHCPFQSRRGIHGACGRNRGGHGMDAFQNLLGPLLQQGLGAMQTPNNQEGTNPLGSILESVLGSFFPGGEGKQEEEEKKESPCSNEKKNCERKCPFGKQARFAGCGGARRFPFCGGFNPTGACGSMNPQQCEELKKHFGGIINGVKENIDSLPHFGVSCDGCGKTAFVGKRWKCADCDNFDFCDKCFEEKAQSHAEGFHSFAQVEPKGKNFIMNFINGLDKQEQPTQESQSANVEHPSAPSQDNQQTELDEQLYPSFVEATSVEQPISQNIVQESPVSYPTAPQDDLNTIQVNAVPIVQEPIQQPFSQQLSILRDMGFQSDELTLRLLTKYNGDVQKTVSDLLYHY